MVKAKPILVTNIDDLLIGHEAFSEPHKKVWATLIKKTGDKKLSKWIGKKDYFVGVNLAMDKIMPKATREKKTLQVRSWYQKAVIEYIQDNPDCVNKSVADRLKQLKTKFKLILLTSNTEKYIDKILKSAGLTGLYDAIIASGTEQEPKKSDLIEDLLLKYGKPIYYLTGKEDQETNEIFKQKEIKVITKEEIDSI
jgi:phosphoglycolate phosphatase-like HAD superfamily hydrolase